MEIQRAQSAIDSVTDIGLAWMEGKPSYTRAEIKRVFAGSERLSHYVDKWDGDFAGYYLNMDEGMKRKFFTCYEIPLEPDRFKDSLSLNLALIRGVDKFKVFPFESYAVQLFYLTACNNSIQILQKISLTDAMNRIQEYGIDFYGNGLNWSKAWALLTKKEKERFVNHLIKDATGS
jgi:hypothetical protein